MSVKSHMKGKVQLEYRPEQIMLNEQLKSTWNESLLMTDMEKELIVSHPEVAPKPYSTKIDLWYLIKGSHGNQISICIDMHGTWHEKNKVQVRDENKRLALEYCGHHYIEIRNYAGAEECPSIWDAVKEAKMLPKILKPQIIIAHQQSIQRKMRKAMIEISQQMTIQMAENTPRNITPSL